jgi:hypothetical protein
VATEPVRRSSDHPALGRGRLELFDLGRHVDVDPEEVLQSAIPAIR